MPTAYRNIIDDAKVLFGSADARNLNIYNHLLSVANAIEAENWLAAATGIRNVAQAHIATSWTQSHWPYPYTCYVTDALYWIDDNWPSGGEPYELTIDKMLEAMWDGDLLRWFHFVTYIDSMRAGIWNLEIYDTHLSDLYRHFSV